MVDTYAGSKLRISAALPAANPPDAASYATLKTNGDFVEGSCALKEVPRIAREWAVVSNELVCQTTNSDVKGSSKWQPVTFTMNTLPSDPAQLIYRNLEQDSTGVGAFELELDGTGGTVYFTAQVRMFDIVGGGGQDATQDSSVELLIQSEPVFVAAP